MSKVIAEFDTVEKTLAVSIDGQSVSNATFIYFGKKWCGEDEDTDNPKFCCEINTMMEDEASEIKTMTRLIASKSEDGQTIIYDAKPSAQFPEFYSVPTKTKAELDIEKYFSE